MRIHHLINGKSVHSRDTFETLNPATQEVLAEVDAGGETEVNAAVAAAKAAFPRWAGLAATERAIEESLRALRGHQVSYLTQSDSHSLILRGQ